MEHAFTEAAQRVLARAGQLAAKMGDLEGLPAHLLWALLDDESRAAEVIAEHGLSSEMLKRLHLGCIDPDRVGFDSSVEPASAADVPYGETLLRVVEAARARVAMSGRHAEVGSEHLLWGLVKIDSPVADALHARGLDCNKVALYVSRTTGFHSGPIAVDFDIRRHQDTRADTTDTLRIIDAAANRAREGLRVLEDYVRFTLDDAHLTGLLKNCRHDLREALQTIDSGRLLAARETLQDVGTSISTPAEMLRSSSTDVVRANFKRVQEATRTLEEFGKVISSEFAEQIGHTRYELYTLEKAVLLSGLNRRRLEGLCLCLLVTQSLCDHGSGPAIRGALSGGAGIVQIREKTMPDRALVEYAKQARRWTHETDALLIINDRPDLAVLVDADGVHVGQEELSVRQARRIVGPDRLVGMSTHSIEQARQAVLDGADYLGVGPVFPSATKNFDQLAGLEFVREVAAEITLPWFAIGGIDVTNIGALLDAGATRIAVTGVICGAEDPRAATESLLASLSR